MFRTDLVSIIWSIHSNWYLSRYLCWLSASEVEMETASLSNKDAVYFMWNNSGEAVCVRIWRHL